MFDYVRIMDGYTESGEHVPNTRFKCPAGHDLKEVDFQTKDFGCTLGMVEIYPDEVRFAPQYDIAGAETVGTGTFNVYASCKPCEPGDKSWSGLWCEFEMVLKDWKIVSVKLTESSY